MSVLNQRIAPHMPNVSSRRHKQTIQETTYYNLLTHETTYLFASNKTKKPMQEAYVTTNLR